MHLASAAFRLPVALQKTIEARPGAATVFGDLWGPSNKKGALDWRRKEGMFDSFSKVKALGDCAMGALGGTVEERLQYATTIITVIRDDFGHGEEGDSGPGTYMGDREAVLNTLYTCRIVEAAQLLIDWALGKLSPPSYTVDPRGPKRKRRRTWSLNGLSRSWPSNLAPPRASA